MGEGQRASCSRLIFHDDGLIQIIAHEFGEDAYENVCAAAWREWHDHGDWPRRIKLSVCRHRPAQSCRSREFYEIATSHDFTVIGFYERFVLMRTCSRRVAIGMPTHIGVHVNPLVAGKQRIVAVVFAKG